MMAGYLKKTELRMVTKKRKKTEIFKEKKTEKNGNLSNNQVEKGLCRR